MVGLSSAKKQKAGYTKNSIGLPNISQKQEIKKHYQVVYLDIENKKFFAKISQKQRWQDLFDTSLKTVVNNFREKTHKKYNFLLNWA